MIDYLYFHNSVGVESVAQGLLKSALLARLAGFMGRFFDFYAVLDNKVAT